ncbi:MAG TPA: single-stranded-DNA-specific exonuclease RecJ [Dehalococcoidia bacterium]|nr:single-stranded-DNA-specific exonuclease RecJ [Dehalococcoidia bacterium]
MLPQLGAYPPLIARLLAQRGIRSEAEAQVFLGDSQEEQPNPFLLPDMDRAVARLQAALAGHEQIAIHGDFDVDGITATAILTEGLSDLGGHVTPFIPNRFSDGYGVTQRTLGRLADSGIRLVITVDCGISCVEEISEARRRGVDVIIVDHHEVGAELPAAVAVVDPKRPDARYPTHDLCSGALSLRLLQALHSALGTPLEMNRYLDIAALATVCDMVPLQGENRILVRAGLSALSQTSRPGLRALLRAGNAAGDAPDASTLGFRLGPRLNAAGRLADASLALELLMTRDEGRAAAITEQLTGLNQERQRMVEEALVLAAELAACEPADAAALVIGHPHISRGIVGLIASRLVEMYHRPAFVYEQSAGECVGSARGIPGFDVVQALGEARHLLTRHGGHRAAGGFALATENVERFKAAIHEASARQIPGAPVAEPLEIDVESALRAIDQTTLAFLARFEPCGMGNTAPVLTSSSISVQNRKTVGQGKHLMLDVRDGPALWRGFAFGRGDAAVSVGARLDIVYSVEKGSRGFGPRLRLLDWRDSKTMGAA